MLIFDQLFKTLGINSGLDEKQWDVDPREIKPQAEIKPTEPQGLFGPIQSRVGRFLQGDTGFPNPFEGLPKPQLPEPGITSEGTITKNYTPGVSEVGYLATNLVDLIGGGVQDFLTTAGEGLQEWGEGYPLSRQTEMGGYIPWATKTGKKNIETAIGAAPIGVAARRTIGEGIDAVGGLFKQLEPPSPGTAGMFYGAKGARNIQGEGATAQQLAKATKLEELGSGREEIYRETGMFRGPDNQWRYGWADLSRMESSPYGGSPEPEVIDPFRSLVVNEENLYKAYPEFESGLLAEYRPQVYTADDMMFSPEGEQGLISYGRTTSPESQMTGYAHELGHAVARKEGFDPGTSYDDFVDRYTAEEKRLKQMIAITQQDVAEGKPGSIELLEKLNKENERFIFGPEFAAEETYRSKGGEVMSRLEEAMLRTPPEDVGRQYPWEMYDVPEESIWLKKTQGPQNKAEKTQSGLPRIEAEKSEATGLFSKMEEEILNMPQEKMTTQQFRNYLEGRGVKRNEINESGILGQIADENNRVTKSRALNFLRERDVPKIDEVYMGEMPEDLFDPADWRIDPDNAQIVPMEQGQLDDMIETALDDELGGGQWNGTRENARDYVRLLNEYDPDTYPLDDPNDNWADAFVNTVVFEGIRSNDIPPSIYDDIKTIIGEREAAVYDDMAEYTWTVGDPAGHQEFTVTGNMDQGFTITNAHTGEWISDAPTIEEANIQLRVIGRQVSEDLSERSAAATTMFSEWTPDNMNLGTYEEETIYLPRLSKEAREYTGPHWDNPDVGLHLRTSIEELDNGADTLFVLENQSDLHQRGRKYGYDDSTPEQRKAKVAKADQNLKDAERKTDTLGIEFANKAESGDFPPETLKNLDDLLDQYYRLGAGISPNDFPQNVRRRKIANQIIENYSRDPNAGMMPTPKPLMDATINTVDKDPNLQKYISAFKAKRKASEMADAVRKRPPRALLEGDQVIETGFNRAVMKAITEDKDGISWATAEMQKNLYPNAKSDTLYENQYDKKMVSYAKKLATKYNTKVEMVGSKMVKPPVKGKEPEYYQVHYLPFTKEMKAELKKKGMPLYSGAPAAGLLAGEEDAGENQQKGLLGM